jgi:hypothetical protein
MEKPLELNSDAFESVLKKLIETGIVVDGEKQTAKLVHIDIPQELWDTHIDLDVVK